MKKSLVVMTMVAFLVGVSGVALADKPSSLGVAGALLGLRAVSGKKEEPKPVEKKAEKKGAKPAAKKAAPAKGK